MGRHRGEAEWPPNIEAARLRRWQRAFDRQWAKNTHAFRSRYPNFDAYVKEKKKGGNDQ